MKRSKWDWAGPILNLKGNISREDAEAIVSEALSRKENIYSIQFWGDFKVKSQTLEFINSYILTQFPYCGFRIRDDYPLSPSLYNLDFLKLLSNLTSLRCEINPSVSLSPISMLPKLRTLMIMSEKPIEIRDIIAIESITDLTLYGKIKDIQGISVMNNLIKLELWRQTLKSLTFLKPLINLTELSFVLGGTKNLSGIGEIGKIKKLSLTWVKGLENENFLPINEMPFLEELYFEKLPKLTDLNWLKKKHVNIKVVECKNFEQASS